MILVRIADANHEEKGTNLGLKISNWCKEQGLEHQKDFEWWLDSNHWTGTGRVTEVHVRFSDEHESTATYLALMWAK